MKEGSSEVKKIGLRILVVSALVSVGVIGAASVASANGAFLCPVVGDGVLNADMHNGDHGVSAIQPPVGTSFLPGKNQAGANANPHAYNTQNPDTAPPPGNGNSDFSPIWPGDTGQ
jgi:hypothetical protein